MSPFSRNTLCGAAALAGAFFGLAAFAQEEGMTGEAPPAASQPVPLFAVQGNDLPVPIDAGAWVFQRPSITVTGPPAHGDYVGQAGLSFLYKPASGYFGYDRLSLRVDDGAQALDIEYEITVLPARIPLAGSWQGDAVQWPGLYVPQDGWLQLCSGLGPPEVAPDGAAYEPLICSWQRVLGAPPAAYAFTWPIKAGLDEVALFAPATGALYQLVPTGADLQAVEIQVIPEALGRFPAAGVFRADEPVTVAFTSRQGDVGMIGSAGEWVDWVRPFEAPRVASDDLAWPVVLPFAEADGLAKVDPFTGDMSLLSPIGDRHDWKSTQPPIDARRPFGASRSLKQATVPTLVAVGSSSSSPRSTTATACCPIRTPIR